MCLFSEVELSAQNLQHVRKTMINDTKKLSYPKTNDTAQKAKFLQEKRGNIYEGDYIDSGDYIDNEDNIDEVAFQKSVNLGYKTSFFSR
jgi:hypothetical protein